MQEPATLIVAPAHETAARIAGGVDLAAQVER